MDPSDIGFLKAVVAFVLVTGTAFGAVRTWLRLRGSSPLTDRILDDLRDENAQLRAELEARMGELEERVDFAERRLVQQSEGRALPEGRIPTPV